MDDAALTGADIEVPSRDVCSFYQWLENRAGHKEVPYIAAIDGTAVVEGLLSPMYGASERCGDERSSCNQGNTWVNHVEELHLADGSVQAGAFGTAILGPNRADATGWCEWRDAIEVDQ